VTRSTVSTRLLELEHTDSLGVQGTVGNNDIRYLCLFVNIVLIGGFDEGKVLLQNTLQITSSFIDITNKPPRKTDVRVLLNVYLIVRPSRSREEYLHIQKFQNPWIMQC